MSRYAHERRTPNVRRKERVELSEGNIVLRLLGVGAAILIAALAFGSAISNLLHVQTGWQIIEASNPETGIAEQFALSYEIGVSGQNATAELKAVTEVYTQSVDHAYRVLTSLEQAPYHNVHTLNANPNEAVIVDPLLYDAFSMLAEQGSRLPYFAPLLDQYESLFACTYDEAAEKFDPEHSEDVAKFAAEIAVFANDPAMIEVEVLADHQLRLKVAPEYLAYAQENELDRFVDLGILLNAFICDAVADELAERGYTRGYLVSLDGYSRVLCGEEMGMQLYTSVNGEAKQAGTAAYTGPAAVVQCRSFPVREQESVNYYTYSDGAVRGPYIGADGLLHSAGEHLITMDPSPSVAKLAAKTVEAFAAEWNPEALQGTSWLLCHSGTITQSGAGFRVEK